MRTQKVQLNYLPITPRKVRLIANTLKGLSVAEAEAQLLLRPQRAAAALLKLLRSAVANAKNNLQLTSDKLRVSGIWVDPAPTLKRSLPRAQGRATPILKRMSHVTLILAETKSRPSRFVIAEPEKKKTKTEKKKEKQKGKPVDKEHTRPEPKEGELKEAAPKKSPGIFKRFFQRKSI